MSFRSFAPWLPHLPWVAAAVVLAAGVLSWATRRDVPAEPVAQQSPPVYHIDEESFRNSLKLEDLYGEMPLLEDKR